MIYDRASNDYEKGATDFVNKSALRLGNRQQIFCPCVNCRNMCHQTLNTVVEHLFIRGMDKKYKRNDCWSVHGEIRKTKTAEFESVDNLEAYELFRTAFSDAEDNPQTGEQPEVVKGEEDSEFKKKLLDAETPLYSNCPNYTKISAIMGLYRLKVKSGISENYLIRF